MSKLQKYTATWVVERGDGSMQGEKHSVSVMATSKEHALSKIMGKPLEQMRLIATFGDEIDSGIFDHSFLLWT